MRQALAQLAAGVERGKVLGAEAFAERDGDGQSVAEGEHGGGGGGRREAEAAGFGGNRAVEGDGAGCGEGRLHVADEGDEGVAHALQSGQEAQDLLGFAAGGEGDDHVAFGDHAEVAMDGFGRMKEERRAAGGTEGGGDLLGDDAAFTHAGDDDAAARLSALDDAVDGALEVGGHGPVEALGEGQQRFGFDPNELGRSVDVGHGLKLLMLPPVRGGFP